jgi:hypothetical protein
MNSRKLNALCISAIMQAFGCDHRKGNIFLQLQLEGLGTDVRNKEFSLHSLLNSRIFTFISLC